MKNPEHIFLGEFMLGRATQRPFSELYISAELKILPLISHPPATMAISPRLADPNKHLGDSIDGPGDQEFVRMLYLQITTELTSLPNTSNSVPTASDSLSEQVKHSPEGIRGRRIHRCL
uniref:Uncharacterized protein n=1 Tax=Nymphaea colorata TaxID=210225 RepID=A0A5K1ATE3_9MAGN